MIKKEYNTACKIKQKFTDFNKNVVKKILMIWETLQNSVRILSDDISNLWKLLLIFIISYLN